MVVRFGCGTPAPTLEENKMNDGEKKFHNDLSLLIQRAFRAGATLNSITMVLETVQKELTAMQPYLKAMAEKDLAP